MKRMFVEIHQESYNRTLECDVPDSMSNEELLAMVYRYLRKQGIPRSGLKRVYLLCYYVG